jgi:hypothetical protein
LPCPSHRAGRPRNRSLDRLTEVKQTPLCVSPYIIRGPRRIGPALQNIGASNRCPAISEWYIVVPVTHATPIPATFWNSGTPEARNSESVEEQRAEGFGFGADPPSRTLGAVHFSCRVPKRERGRGRIEAQGNGFMQGFIWLWRSRRCESSWRWTGKYSRPSSW